MKYSTLAWWRMFMFYGIRLYEGEGDGGGSGGGGGDDKIAKADAEKMVAEAVENATKGLKSKNSELIGETKKLAEKLKGFGDLTPEKVQEMMKKFDNDDDANLLKSGQIDELVAKRVDKVKAEYDSEREQWKKREAELNEGISKSDRRYNNRVVSEETMKAALASGVRPEAMDDLIAQARSLFTVGDDDEVEARDKDGNLRKIGDKLMTLEHWIDSLKTSKPHYWPESAGVGAKGNKGDAGGKSSDIKAKLEAAASAGDMAEYRRLRKESAGKK